MRPGVSKESEKSLKPWLSGSFRTLLRLRGALFREFGGSRPGDCFRTFSGLFSDSSGVPGPEGPGDPVRGGAGPKERFKLVTPRAP